YIFLFISLSLSPSSPLLLSHPLLLLWDHGNCASSVAFPALPAALREEACSNDLLLSSLAIIALTINSRLAFLLCQRLSSCSEGLRGMLFTITVCVSPSETPPGHTVRLLPSP
ncbi:hypothetical protein JOQ06_012764, partial [Pogonophryne albipinna]